MLDKLRFAISLSVLGLLGCAPQLPVSTKPFVQVPYTTLQNWSDEDFGSAITSMTTQCRKLVDLPPDAHLGGEKTTLPSGGVAQDWRLACHAVLTAPPKDSATAKLFFETWFTPYYVNARDCVDGFSEVEMDGSRLPGGEYQTPVYAKPGDLVRTSRGANKWTSGRWIGTHFTPYYTRAEIDAGVLSNKSLEIAWVKSQADLFILQLQGSGRLKMRDGQTIHIAYAARNGRPYTPLGRYLQEHNYITLSQMSAFAIRDWLKKYPAQAPGILAQNEDYVFFKTLPPDSLSTGAPGVMGIGLTPWRSVRADPGYLPFGTPVWLEMKMPPASGGSGRWRHLTYMQDANRGMDAGKVSLFTGWGTSADQAAMYLNSSARIFVLLPRKSQ